MNEHISVLLPEVIEALAMKARGIYIDATFGRGGYSRAMLLAQKDTSVYGFDRDPEAIAAGDMLADECDRFVMIRGPFSTLEEKMASAKVDFVDGIAFDLGVSSPQLDDAHRGFSFRHDGPLDMRMDNKSGETAAELVNSCDEKTLADLIWKYGEEKFSRRVASAIVSRRKSKSFSHTLDLAAVVRAVVPASKDGMDPATRTFQALRIAVNDELGELERGLQAAERRLKVGGRLVVVSFHSLEDRIVKQFFRDRSGRTAQPSRYVPVVADTTAPTFKLIGKQPIVPTSDEQQRNFRARSARLRVGEKIISSVHQGVRQ